MKALVTGATGLVGNAVAKLLASRGHEVRVLVRDPAKAARLLPAEVERVAGDIQEPATLGPAMKDRDWVFHAAGIPEQWQADPSIFDRVNRQGTKNVLEAALAAGVRRAVYTSTMDVFAAPSGGTLVETNLDPQDKHTAYERSKQAADREAEAVRAKGLEVVHVNPSAVYGPGPVHVALNSFFIKLLNGEMPVVPPGGMSVVHVTGVAEMHLAAAEKGRSGERYLVSDTHATNKELAAEIARQVGLRRIPPAAPAPVVKALAAVSAPFARAFHVAPIIAPSQVTFLLWNVRADSTKAQRELGFTPLPLSEGVSRTITFLRAEGLVPTSPPR